MHGVLDRVHQRLIPFLQQANIYVVSSAFLYRGLYGDFTVSLLVS